MKIIRFKYKKETYYGTLEDNAVYMSNISPYEVDSFKNSVNFKHPIDINEVEFLNPIKPSKIIGIAENYHKKGKVVSKEYEPLVFLKAPNTLSIQSKIKKPFNLNAWGESELGVVIGKKIQNISKSNVSDSILGFALTNDITISNIHNRDHHLARSKSIDNFCPISKFIDTKFRYNNKIISSYHNGILLRKASTNKMIWNIEEIISNISKWMTLEAGDLILTGAPPRVRDRMFIKNGDVFTVMIEGLGKMDNKFYE